MLKTHTYDNCMFCEGGTLLHFLAYLNRQADRHTYSYFIRRILAYIFIQNGLQYNAHDSGYSSI